MRWSREAGSHRDLQHRSASHSRRSKCRCYLQQRSRLLCGTLAWRDPAQQVGRHGCDRWIVKHQGPGQVQAQCLAQLVAQLHRRQAVKAACIHLC